MAPLPARVVAGYWTYWGSPIRLTDLPVHYNVVFLFHATPVGGAPGTTGAVQWNTPGDGRGAATAFVQDLAEFRRTRTAILTVGGARAHVDLSSRARAQTFLDSIKRIYGEMGGFDGLDWNTYEGEQAPNTDQVIWISQQLKSIYGSTFAITSPPAPWRRTDMAHCRAMLDAGVLDMVSPQYYDGPAIAEEEYIVSSVNEWVAHMGDAGRVGIGFGLASAPGFSTTDTVQRAWRTLSARHPDLRGAFNWAIPADEASGWPFADEVGPVVMMNAPKVLTPPVSLPPIIPLPIAGGQRMSSTAGSTHDGNPSFSGGVMSGGAVARLPKQVLGTYWNPASGLPLKAVHPAFNVVFVALARTSGEDGPTRINHARSSEAAFVADLSELRGRDSPPKIILTGSCDRHTSGAPTRGRADDFAAEIARICAYYGFDGFDWELEPRRSLPPEDLERASRRIVAGMRRIEPTFSLTASPRPAAADPDGDADHFYAEFARRCRSFVDMVQAQYHSKDDRRPDLDQVRFEVRAWRDRGLRENQIGVLSAAAPMSTSAGYSQVAELLHAERTWSVLRGEWPELRGMSARSSSQRRAAAVE